MSEIMLPFWAIFTMSSAAGVIRAYDSLKSLCNEVKLQNPQRITSVSLRKYTATVSQVFDLSPQEQLWLTNHLGHTMDVHKIHYRQTSGIIERVDLAKIMLLQEYNMTSKFAGKKLADIQMPGLVFGEDGGGDGGEDGGENEAPPVVLEDDVVDPDYQPDTLQAGEVRDEYEFDDDDDDDDGNGEQAKSRKRRKHGNCVSSRVRWTPLEVEEIEEYFKDNLRTRITTGRKECEHAISLSRSKNGPLHGRNWETIKKKVWNMIKKQ